MAKKKSRKAKSQAKSEEIVTEERETRVYPARKRAPATLSEAIGEPVVTEPTPVRRVVRTRRAA